MTRCPTLDEIETAGRPPRPYYRPRLADDYSRSLPVLGALGGCWCGAPHGHDWPGRDQGAPHPRQEEDHAPASQRVPG